MRTQKVLFAIVWVFVTITFFACNEDIGEDPNLVGVSDPGTVTDNTSLFGVNSFRDEVRGSGIGSPMGLIYGKLANTANGRSEWGVLETNQAVMNGRMSITNARVATDSAEFEHTDSLEHESCWRETYTFTENSFEYTLDFGDGCWFEGEFLKGKLHEYGTFDEGNFRVEVEYFYFGTKYRTVNGREVYEGVWLEHETDSALWEVEYEFTSDLDERLVDGDRVTEISTNTVGSEHITAEGLTVQSRERFISTSKDETYESAVVDPLYFDFTCNGIEIEGEDELEEIIIYTRGIEEGTYSVVEGDAIISGTFLINYGDGTCDNIITVTRDDVVEEINVAEEWEKEEEEECEEDDHVNG